MSWKKSLRQMIRRTGYDVARYRPRDDGYIRLVEALNRRSIPMLLDVGANSGQFAQALLRAGFAGNITSFEPVAEAHAALVQSAAGEARWRVFERCGLGDEAGSISINVSANSQVSSMLALRDDAEEAATGASYVSAQQVPIFRLDQVIDRAAPAQGPLALKMDVQGFETKVLAGASACMNRIDLIATEMSLAPMYEDETLFRDLYDHICSLGFRCIGLSPAYIHQKTLEVMHLDGVFVRS
jgi:FkbM family methyltransferase